MATPELKYLQQEFRLKREVPLDRLLDGPGKVYSVRFRKGNVPLGYIAGTSGCWWTSTSAALIWDKGWHYLTQQEALNGLVELQDNHKMLRDLGHIT